MEITTAYCGAEFFRKPGKTVFFARQRWRPCEPQDVSLPPELRLSEGPGQLMGLHKGHPQDQPVLFGTTGTVRSFGTECFGRFAARGRLDLAHVLGSSSVTNVQLECNGTLCSSVPVMKTNGERDGQMVNYFAYQHATEYFNVNDRCRFLDLQWMYGTQMVFLNQWHPI
ncbi:hypothetical protein FGB62_46g15 [Gracilaria domingensis]|nr:hypothetical protein FGB62_46g15 [Gracilaria domingensis]